MKHKAIYELHTNVAYIVDQDDGTVIAYDSNDNVVTFSASEETAINSKSVEFDNAFELGRLRIERNKKLAETDHYGLSDQTMSAAMTTYRQALRDITDNYSSLDTVVWPTKP
jgi:hypothetical protein